MKYIDFTFQTLILLLGLGIVLFMDTQTGWPLRILFMQFFLGAWQLSSSIVSTIARTPFWKVKRVHLIISLIYLTVLYVLFQMGLCTSRFDALFNLLILMVPSWILGIGYYIVTCKWAFAKKRNSGSFLPNLSF